MSGDDPNGAVHSVTEVGGDGVRRCGWATGSADYAAYHDHEWGFGEADDARLFEKVCLEGFQAGLSWLTVLRKRDRFREVFEGFVPEVVASFGDGEVDLLLGDAGIIRHQGKIRSTINNAQRAREIIDEFGSLATFFWSWAELDDRPPATVPAVTAESTRLSKQLKARGWTFVGPTTMYAFMQAMGLVNDHFGGCDRRQAAQASRLQVVSGVAGVERVDPTS